jgi:hypothetical protein
MWKEATPMKHTRKLALGSAVITASAALIGIASTPAMASGQYCTTNVYKICETVSGYSNHINQATATATVELAGDLDFHVQMINPQGSTLCNSNTVVNSADGVTVSCPWTPNANENTGNYCAVVWEYVPPSGAWGSSGYYENEGQSCLYVS